jgi:hypothetical protein
VSKEELAVLLPPEGLLHKGDLVVWHGGVLRVPTGIAVTLAVDAPTRAFLDGAWESTPPGEREALSVTAEADGVIAPVWSWYTPMPQNLRCRAVFAPDHRGVITLMFEVRPLGLTIRRRVDV